MAAVLAVFFIVGAVLASEAEIGEVVVGVEVGLLKDVRPTKIKLTNKPLFMDEAIQVDHILWTTNGADTQQAIYCVGKMPSKLMRFECVDCELLNVTDIIDVLNNAKDITEKTGFPTIALENIPAEAMKIHWTGLRVVCQAALNETDSELGIENSEPAVLEVRMATFDTPHEFTRARQRNRPFSIPSKLVALFGFLSINWV